MSPKLTEFKQLRIHRQKYKILYVLVNYLLLFYENIPSQNSQVTYKVVVEFCFLIECLHSKNVLCRESHYLMYRVLLHKYWVFPFVLIKMHKNISYYNPQKNYKELATCMDINTLYRPGRKLFLAQKTLYSFLAALRLFLELNTNYFLHLLSFTQ